MASLDKVIENVLKTFQIQRLKTEQRAIFDALWCSTDCLGVLPTGFGKSLPYQILSSVRKIFSSTETSQKIIVCCPLVALMSDQVCRLRQIPDVSAVYLGESAESDMTVKEGKFDYLFASPEHLVGDDSWRNIIKDFDVSTIVVDEFHTITSWGDDDKGKAFRKWFSYIGELRSLFPSASILALSATCKRSHYKKVMSKLNMKEDTVFVKVSPNRENIKLSVQKISSVEYDFLNIADALQENKMPRTLIYCSSIKDVALIYGYLVNEANATSSYIGMYHSETPTEKKEEIHQLLKNVDEKFVIVATNALGMGIDVNNCNNLIIYGAPFSVVDMWQQIGRVGRDGSSSIAILAYSSHHLRSAEDDVKLIYKTKGCRRIAAITDFITKKEQAQLQNQIATHQCCDFCEKACVCGSCSFSSVEKMFMSNTMDSESDDCSDDSKTISYCCSDLDDRLSDWDDS